jgi:hypothetical protein
METLTPPTVTTRDPSHLSAHQAAGVADTTSTAARNPVRSLETAAREVIGNQPYTTVAIK